MAEGVGPNATFIGARRQSLPRAETSTVGSKEMYPDSLQRPSASRKLWKSWGVLPTWESRLGDILAVPKPQRAPQTWFMVCCRVTEPKPTASACFWHKNAWQAIVTDRLEEGDWR